MDAVNVRNMLPRDCLIQIVKFWLQSTDILPQEKIHYYGGCVKFYVNYCGASPRGYKLVYLIRMLIYPNFKLHSDQVRELVNKLMKTLTSQNAKQLITPGFKYPIYDIKGKRIIFNKNQTIMFRDRGSKHIGIGYGIYNLFVNNKIVRIKYVCYSGFFIRWHIGICKINNGNFEVASLCYDSSSELDINKTINQLLDEIITFNFDYKLFSANSKIFTTYYEPHVYFTQEKNNITFGDDWTF